MGEYITLKEAIPLITQGANSGIEITHETVRRWCLDGVRGVKLDHVRIGIRYYTTRSAIEKFQRETGATP